jgi:hypothetical protein
MTKSVPRPEDLSVVLSISDDPAEAEFWRAQHTAFHLFNRRLPIKHSASNTTHESTRIKGSRIAAVGCRDGSVWLLDTGSSRKVRTAPAIISVEDTDSAVSSKIGTPAGSIRHGSPMLSRTPSSTFLPSAALSPASVFKGEFPGLSETISSSSKTDRPRVKPVLPPKPKTETFVGLGFLPSLSATGKSRSTSVSQSTATARLTSISAADDKALRIRLKDANRDSGDEAAGSLMKLVGDARGGLDDLHGKSEMERSNQSSRNTKSNVGDFRIAIPHVRSASEIRDEKRMDLEVAEAIHEEEEIGKLREALENTEERACRACESIDGTSEDEHKDRNPFLVRFVPAEGKDVPIVDIRSSPVSSAILALNQTG